MKKPQPTGRIVGCPQCRKPTAYDEKNPWRPFCSERCKTGDMANWATDSYRIAGEQISEEDLVHEMTRGKDDEST